MIKDIQSDPALCVYLCVSKRKIEKGLVDVQKAFDSA